MNDEIALPSGPRRIDPTKPNPIWKDNQGPSTVQEVMEVVSRLPYLDMMELGYYLSEKIRLNDTKPYSNGHLPVYPDKHQIAEALALLSETLKNKS